MQQRKRNGLIRELDIAETYVENLRDLLAKSIDEEPHPDSIIRWIPSSGRYEGWFYEAHTEKLDFGVTRWFTSGPQFRRTHPNGVTWRELFTWEGGPSTDDDGYTITRTVR